MRRRITVSLAGLAVAVLSAAPAAHAVTVGSPLANADNTSNSCPVTGCTYAQQGVTSPFDGVITQWGFRSGNNSTFTLRVLHSSDAGATWSAVRTSPPKVNTSLGNQTFVPAAVPVSAGDGIGVTEIPSGAPFDNGPLHVPGTGALLYWNSALADGGAPAAPSSSPSIELLLQATIDPAVTSITAHPKPKIKTRKKKVSVGFSFGSNAPGVGFECRLDAAAFGPCSSPTSLGAKRGGHTFTVESTLGGAKFGDPISFAFKVKRKKK